MMSSRSNSVGRLSGCACLLAALSLLLPQVLIGWWTGTGACCKSNYCPISAHHNATKAPASTEHDGMDCEHSALGVAACTISCCRDKENALMAPMAFVLESSPEVQTTPMASRLAAIRTSKDVLLRFAPLSPPPRLAATA